uniref:Uncharacterized protein n=1 Tax=Amphimedon queenslandica TaxID=400682 RepID=A0A1X7TCW7_AMPQE
MDRRRFEAAHLKYACHPSLVPRNPPAIEDIIETCSGGATRFMIYDEEDSLRRQLDCKGR